MHAIRLIITGRVQGVFFRTSAKEKADALGVTGWVRNCDDGSVEIFADGDEAALKKFEEWCWEGPRGAKVTNVQMKKMLSQEHHEFVIQR